MTSRPTLAPQAPRQSGSDRFDQAIEVTRTRAWIGLGSCLVLVAGIVAWAATARVGVTVKAAGVAIANGAIAVVRSPVAGTVQSLTVKVDDDVQPAQVLGTVTNAQNQTSQLVAPVGGRVLSLNSNVGSSIHSDENVLSIAQGGGPLLIRVFVSPTDAEQADVGEKAIISFPEEPEIRGRVQSVGSLPLTKEQVADSIGSAALAETLVSHPAVVDVTVAPEQPADPGKRAHFSSGSVARVTLIVGTRRPIDYVL